MAQGRAGTHGVARAALALAVVVLASSYVPVARADTLFGGLSDDGGKVFFTTSVGCDDFAPCVTDVYEYSDGVNTLVSVPGPGVDAAAGLPVFAGAAADGSKVFFYARDFVGEDTDGLYDLYERSSGVTRQVSVAGAGASGPPAAAQYAGATRDGSRVFFKTSERLAGADIDNEVDIYERAGDMTTLISISAGLGTSWDVEFAGASADGTRVFFQTLERLVLGDDDIAKDVYERSEGTTKLVSAAASGVSGPPHSAYFAASSDDGSRVFFVTREALVAADDDVGDAPDIYERAGGATSLVSARGEGASGPAGDVELNDVSSDGGTVAFSTYERLVGADDDDRLDAYERSGETTKLVSVSGAGASGPQYNVGASDVSEDGATILFGSYERFTADDVDTSFDYYTRANGTTTLVTVPSAGANGPAQDARSAVASGDATHVFFETTERLVGEDTDERNDIYERDGTTTRLVSAPGDGATGAARDVFWSYWLRPVSRNGETAIFETSEQLTGDDNNQAPDSYVRQNGITRLLSARPATVIPPPPPPDPPAPVITPPPPPDPPRPAQIDVSPQTPTITETPSAPPARPDLAAVRSALAADARSAAAALRRFRRSRLLRGGGFTIARVDALLAGTLTAKLSTPTVGRARRLTLAVGRRTFSSAGRAAVRVKLTRGARKLLRKPRRVLILTLRYDDALGRSTQHSARITLKR